MISEINNYFRVADIIDLWLKDGNKIIYNNIYFYSVFYNGTEFCLEICSNDDDWFDESVPILLNELLNLVPENIKQRCVPILLGG